MERKETRIPKMRYSRLLGVATTVTSSSSLSRSSSDCPEYLYTLWLNFESHISFIIHPLSSLFSQVLPYRTYIILRSTNLTLFLGSILILVIFSFFLAALSNFSTTLFLSHSVSFFSPALLQILNHKSLKFTALWSRSIQFLRSENEWFMWIETKRRKHPMYKTTNSSDWSNTHSSEERKTACFVCWKWIISLYD